MSLHLVKSIEKNGDIVWRIRDNKGKHVKYLGTAEKILETFEKSTAQFGENDY